MYKIFERCPLRGTFKSLGIEIDNEESLVILARVIRQLELKIFWVSSEMLDDHKPLTSWLPKGK